jgi:hypothetical protein
MSRVSYKNETIRKAMHLLDELEQSIGGNMYAAYHCLDFPSNYESGTKAFTHEAVQDLAEDYHDRTMTALVQILEHFPKLRGLLDQVEAEVLKHFLNAQEVEKQQKAVREVVPVLSGSRLSDSMF